MAVSGCYSISDGGQVKRRALLDQAK